jgi:CheY-like chemotaxis protein
MKKILVIDDAEFILESTSTLLRFEGYDIVTANNGLVGVEMAMMHKPDLILCDISMPKLDGYGTLERIRAAQETATTPFIFLTAFTEKHNMRQGMEKGADDYLVKPYTRDELIAAIDAQWAKHSLIEKHVQEKVEEVGKSVTYALPHEFRTVLNEVVGSAKYLNMSANDIKPDEIIELSNDIMSSANRLMKITENFLVYVRVESFFSNPAKRSQLRSHKTEEASAMVMDIAAHKAQFYNRDIDLVIENTIPHIVIEIAAESFHKVMDELVDNALRFSMPGSPVLISTWIESGKFFVNIIDHGRGMKKEQISSIAALAQFERTIYEQQGVGLGLIISKRLVELHNGDFNIESAEGTGTSISFSFWIKN